MPFLLSVSYFLCSKHTELVRLLFFFKFHLYFAVVTVLKIIALIKLRPHKARPVLMNRDSFCFQLKSISINFYSSTCIWVTVIVEGVSLHQTNNLLKHILKFAPSFEDYVICYVMLCYVIYVITVDCGNGSTTLYSCHNGVFAKDDEQAKTVSRNISQITCDGVVADTAEKCTTSHWL